MIFKDILSLIPISAHPTLAKSHKNSLDYIIPCLHPHQPPLPSLALNNITKMRFFSFPCLSVL